jgi:transaldolase
MSSVNYKPSAMERLNLTNEGMEVWWDSNPLIYETWCKKFLDNAPGDMKDLLKLQLEKMWNEKSDPMEWVFKGVTTNPPLTKAVFDKLSEEWNPIIKEIIASYPKKNYGEITWEAYKEACKRGAARYIPLYEKSGYKYGYVSAQVDPRHYKNPFEMVKQGVELRSLQPNIMVKIPGTQAGLLAIMILTSLGVPTNATLVFNLPQILGVAEAVKKGKEIGEKYGVDYSKWRSVITIMIGRFEDVKIFAEQAAQRGIELTDEMKRWAGIAVAKKAYKILAERKYPSKLLVASSRVSPKINGNQYIWHIEQLAGGNLVYTMNPELIEAFMVLYQERPIESKINEPVPEEVLKQLLKIPYFSEGYGEDTIQPSDFENIEPTVFTYNQFSKAIEDLESFIGKYFHTVV